MDLAEVKRIPMAEVVRRYGIEINRVGFCRCPFHAEKTASMKIYQYSFHCFGCGAGGDQVDFVSQIESCDFKTAFKMLGGEYVPEGTKGRLKAYKRAADRRTREKRTEQRLERLNASRRLLGAYRHAFDILPADSPFRAQVLAQYYNERLQNEVLEHEFFQLKGGSN